MSLALLSAVGVGCNDADDRGRNSFCLDAKKVMNRTSFPEDGKGVVEDLRSIETAELTEGDESAFASAVDVAESQIARFNTGEAPNGWSTQAASAVATRICGIDIGGFNVMP